MRRLAFFLGFMLFAGAAQADCFEDIGCTDSDNFSRTALRRLSCENLWYVRNRIFDEAGYCFRTHRGRRAFDNSDCFTSNLSKLKLNQIERSNVARIQEAERRKGCPR